MSFDEINNYLNTAVRDLERFIHTIETTEGGSEYLKTATLKHFVQHDDEVLQNILEFYNVNKDQADSLLKEKFEQIFLKLGYNLKEIPIMEENLGELSITEMKRAG